MAVVLEDGLAVPLGQGVPSPNAAGSSLLYDEHIVYDTAQATRVLGHVEVASVHQPAHAPRPPPLALQVKMRYVLKVEFRYH